MHSPISFSESASLVAFVLKMKTPFMKTKSYWSTFAFIGLLIFAYFWPNSGQEMNLLARLSHLTICTGLVQIGWAETCSVELLKH